MSHIACGSWESWQGEHESRIALHGYGHERQGDFPVFSEFRADEVPANWLEMSEERPPQSLLPYLSWFHFSRQESMSASVWIYFCFQSRRGYSVPVVLSVVSLVVFSLLLYWMVTDAMG